MLERTKKGKRREYKGRSHRGLMPLMERRDDDGRGWGKKTLRRKRTGGPRAVQRERSRRMEERARGTGRVDILSPPLHATPRAKEVRVDASARL